jgi:hypothetical protein
MSHFLWDIIKKPMPYIHYSGFSRGVKHCGGLYANLYGIGAGGITSTLVHASGVADIGASEVSRSNEMKTIAGGSWGWNEQRAEDDCSWDTQKWRCVLIENLRKLVRVRSLSPTVYRMWWCRSELGVDNELAILLRQRGSRFCYPAYLGPPTARELRPNKSRRRKYPRSGVGRHDVETRIVKISI